MKGQSGIRGPNPLLFKMAVGSKRHAPAVLLPGKRLGTLYVRLGEPQGRTGRVVMSEVDAVMCVVLSKVENTCLIGNKLEKKNV